eukprot:TRINITY_DN64369_c0_g4_i1.p1 TRINITY_DN64369_c0_g4~~TRINITY_DN64369_c0_g4_i1.p1  ORF type:complete len:173 (+),score=17.84 TRINITY_DN64369_c0_g4_i1:101-619(+)
MPQRRDKLVQVLLTKTRLCKHLQGKDCPYGEKCAFAHSEEELRGLPDLAYTRLCVNFEHGHCRNGASCSFAHGRAALRQRGKVRTTAANASVGKDVVMTDLRSKPLPRISYRFPECTPPESLESLLNWDPAHTEVLQACGYRLSRRNTFLTIDRSYDYLDLLQRSHSWPALT